MNQRRHTLITNENCKNSGNTSKNNQILTFQGSLWNRTHSNPKRPSSFSSKQQQYIQNYRGSMNNNKKVQKSTRQPLTNIQKGYKKSNQMISCKVIPKRCNNHANTHAVFSISSNQHEYLEYCALCAINLVLQDFDLELMNDHSHNTSMKILDGLFQSHKKISQAMNKLQQGSGMMKIKQQIQLTQDKYENIFNKLQQMKKQDILKLELQKLEILESGSTYESLLWGIKKKINYVISEISVKLNSDGPAADISHIYGPIYDKIKVQLGLMEKPLNHRNFYQSIGCEGQQEICERLIAYFSQRIFQLSFNNQDNQLGFVTTIQSENKKQTRTTH